MKIRIQALLLISIIIIACKEKPTAPLTPTANEIWPLAVGNTWTYDIYNYHANEPDSLKLTDTLVYEVSGTIKVLDKEWYECKLNSDKIIYMINHADGLWMYIPKVSPEFYPDSVKLTFKYPTVLNDTNNGYRTESLSHQITTPAGKFDCIRYIDLNRGFYKSNGVFFYPGVGMVEQDYITTINEWQGKLDTICIKMRLRSYNLK